jgi:formate hydrogenlyase subunit 3/multisubunit Na+/H+ antiporter MnhD subunit
MWFSSFPSFYSTHIFIGLLVFGVYDATFKMWAQTDLKKLVAYGTVQEMNLIAVCFLLGGVSSTHLGVLFCITHTILSLMFFYLVEVIYRIYRTRTRPHLFGLFSSSPILSLHVIISVVLYTGLPFTLKFICELNTFLFLVQYSWGQALFIVIVLQFVGSALWIFL